MKLLGKARATPTRAKLRLSALLTLVSCLSISASACSVNRPNPFRQRTAESGSTLRVDNRYWADMTIWVVRGGSRARLGDVSTNGDRTFRIPADMNAPGISVRFLADPVGSDDVYSSPLVALGTDEDYVWTLAVNIEHSTLVRR